MIITQLLRQGLISIKVLLALTIVLGLAYPLAITGVGRMIAPAKASGSPIIVDGRVVGSALIGQSFGPDGDVATAEQDRWFWSRPWAAGDGYDGTASGGTNLSADNAELTQQISQRRALIAEANGVRPEQVPADAVTSSGSGLDPHISPGYAAIQIDRVATARHLNVQQVRALVADHTDGRTLGFLGEPRVNVLELNAALEQLD